jgi:SAM-dependent methyltransferase
MGRFEAPVEFYRFREPYPAAFFENVAARLALNSGTRLLDVACGPGNLAIGFAPFVGSSTAIDPEPGMLRAAKAAAAEANVEITFIETTIEELDCPGGSFDFVTIGRALHWLQHEMALAVLERVVAPNARIAVCGSTTSEARVNGWAAKFKEVRNTWASEPDESRYKIDMDEWFAPSRFRRIDEIAVEHRQKVTIDELVRRALSFSTTSPAVVGEQQPQFEAAIKAAIEPFATSGMLEEEVVAKATVFA